MLEYLHVKNLALIEETEVTFYPGLNILTGETGAGKSLLLGSVGLALGARADAQMIRNGENAALVELSFSVHDEGTLRLLSEDDIFPENGEIVISRKIMKNKSVSRINGETVSLSVLKRIASLLLDVHGQHEHQSLLYPARQIEILDSYGYEELKEALEKTAACYKAYKDCKERLSGYDLSEEERNKEKSFLQYEIDEIENSGIYEGEEEELEASYRKMSNSRKICEALSSVYQAIGYDGGAGDLVGRALSGLSGITSYDKALAGLHEALTDVESMLSDAASEAYDYLSEFNFSEEELMTVETRLDEVRRLMARYGSTTGKIFAYLEKSRERLEFLSDYEEELLKLTEEMGRAENELIKASTVLSEKRKKIARSFEKEIRVQLSDLNFNRCDFEIEFTRKGSYSASGFDSVEFLIATNPGEEVRPLSKVASGGELSRIMLGIKTILAETDNIETLIFDEIDSGISGRTAQLVSQKMAAIAKKHQVLCITHLAQIASMADAHFLIAKNVDNERTVTDITLLDEKSSVDELARILGGAKITDSVIESAGEMKKLAGEYKTSLADA